MQIRSLSRPRRAAARRVTGLVAGLVAGLAGCYVPEPLRGAPCRDSAGCPTEQQCISGVCGGTVAAAPIDGASGGRDAGATDAAADAGHAIGCQTSDACATAATLGAVSGDTDHQTLTAKGSGAAWFRIRVSENDNDVAGVPLRLLATLTPPATAEFAVVIYVNVASDAIECTTVLGTSAAGGPVAQARASWGEDVVADGVDDSRTVSIEVRPVSGSCSPGAPWQLALEGNRN